MSLVNINTHAGTAGAHSYSVDVDAYGRSLEVARVGTLAEAQVIHTAVRMALRHATDPCIAPLTDTAGHTTHAWCDRCETTVLIEHRSGDTLCSRCGLVL